MSAKPEFLVFKPERDGNKETVLRVARLMLAVLFVVLAIGFSVSVPVTTLAAMTTFGIGALLTGVVLGAAAYIED